jgi:hypothetical protein
LGRKSLRKEVGSRKEHTGQCEQRGASHARPVPPDPRKEAIGQGRIEKDWRMDPRRAIGKSTGKGQEGDHLQGVVDNSKRVRLYYCYELLEKTDWAF